MEYCKLINTGSARIDRDMRAISDAVAAVIDGSTSELRVMSTIGKHGDCWALAFCAGRARDGVARRTSVVVDIPLSGITPKEIADKLNARAALKGEAG